MWPRFRVGEFHGANDCTSKRRRSLGATVAPPLHGVFSCDRLTRWRPSLLRLARRCVVAVSRSCSWVTLLLPGLQWHFTRLSADEQWSQHRLVVRDFYPSALEIVRKRLHSWASNKRTTTYTGTFQTLLLGNAGVGKVWRRRCVIHCHEFQLTHGVTMCMCMCVWLCSRAFWAMSCSRRPQTAILYQPVTPCTSSEAQAG